MEELYNNEFTDSEIKEMLNQNSNIINLTNEEVQTNIEILKKIGCEPRHIKNILISNPYYLNKDKTTIINLINFLRKVGLNPLNLVFDSNPWLLNKEVFEIKNYIKAKEKEGFPLSDIIDIIDSNPFIIEE